MKAEKKCERAWSTPQFFCLCKLWRHHCLIVCSWENCSQLLSLILSFFRSFLSLYIYTYIYIHICTYIYTYMYLYIYIYLPLFVRTGKPKDFLAWAEQHSQRHNARTFSGVLFSFYKNLPDKDSWESNHHRWTLATCSPTSPCPCLHAAKRTPRSQPKLAEWQKTNQGSDDLKLTFF